MRQALQDSVDRASVKYFPVSVPAPNGGWNTKDPLAAMPPTDAVVVDNWVVYPSVTVMRKGAANHVTAFPGNREVESLMAYKSQNGTAKLFAATSVGIYDATSAGAVGAAVVVGTNARWQYVNFTNSANSWLICVNGADSLQEYNGAAWTAVATLGAVNTNTLIGVEVFKQRLYFVPVSELAFYYLPTGAVSGATFTKFNLGQVCRRGGYLMAMCTWTIDAGNGQDDMLAMITSEGEVIVYQGDDPSNAATWQLVGVFYVGRPVGRRCMAKYGGDVLIICDQGVLPLSKALQSATVDKSIALTDKIQPTLLNDTTQYFSTFGWEICVNTAEAFLLVNMPGFTYQYVMGMQSGGWSRFTNWDANCFVMFEGSMYYGTTGKVVKCYTGYQDFGANIQSDLVPAFQYFQQGSLKQLSMLRPTWISDGPFGYSIGICRDFVVLPPTSSVSAVSGGASLWDSGVWDVALWQDQSYVTKQWRSVSNAPWYSMAPYFRVSSGTIRAGLVSIDYVGKKANSFL